MAVKTINKELNKTIGEKLLRVRQRSGLSQSNVAFDLDFSSTAYSKLENGKVDFTATRLKQLSDYFKVKMSDFLDDYQETPRYLKDVKSPVEFRDLETKNSQLMEVIVELQKK